MRNSGGFQLPPQMPQDAMQRSRAIELLGSYTQRGGMRNSVLAELQSLVGEIPSNRLIAQQWKGSLESYNRELNRLVDPSAFKNVHQIAETLALPYNNSTVQRCFILLECLNRRYQTGQPVNPKVIRELTFNFGSYPTSPRQVHLYKRALTFLSRKRKSSELRPPRIPYHSIEDLNYSCMLLGSYARKGTVGRQKEKLQYLIGALPRNKNIAASWKKIVMAAIRKKLRRERRAIRVHEIETIRLQRRLRRLKRNQETSEESPSPPEIEAKKPEQVLNTIKAYPVVSILTMSSYLACY